MPSPSKQVFVSHSTHNEQVAEAIQETLERAGIACWIAPRDIPPGATWAKAIMGGIEQCRMIVMVSSEASNRSEHVKREISLAVDRGQPAVMFRTDSTPLAAELSYLLSTHQFVEVQASASPRRAQLEELVGEVVRVLAECGVVIAPQRKPRWKLRLGLLVATPIFLVALASWSFLAVDEWLDHGEPPLRAATNAVAGLLSFSPVEAAGLDDLTASLDSTDVERSDRIDQLSAQLAPALKSWSLKEVELGEATHALASLTLDLAEIEEHNARSQRLPSQDWLTDQQLEKLILTPLTTLAELHAAAILATQPARPAKVAFLPDAPDALDAWREVLASAELGSEALEGETLEALFGRLRGGSPAPEDFERLAVLMRLAQAPPGLPE